ncbi:unnamed protein product [Amoebophrya sp. A25]|nr:unnamed protein product [Amoebophrya sp. A25]|eukprot:GSA25T00021390001.1
MVFPLSLSLQGLQMTPEVASSFAYLKYLVLVMWLLMALRFLSADLSGALNELLSGLAGVFLLKDDAMWVTCWETFFKDGCLSFFSGGGGLRCLPYCCFIWGVNGFFDLALAANLISKYGGLVPCDFSLICAEPLFALVAGMVQFGSSIFVWNLIKMQLSSSSSAEVGGQGGGAQNASATSGGGFFSGGLLSSSGSYVQDGVVTAPSGGPQQASGFSLFGGTGQTLGGTLGGETSGYQPVAGESQSQLPTQPGFQPFTGTGQRLEGRV